MAMAVAGVLVLGWLSLDRLPLEFLPSFSGSHLTVTAPYRSSSPEAGDATYPLATSPCTHSCSA